MIVLVKETRAIIATGRRVVLRLPGRGSALYGEGKSPSGPRVACGTKKDVELDMVLIRGMRRKRPTARRCINVGRMVFPGSPEKIKMVT